MQVQPGRNGVQRQLIRPIAVLAMLVALLIGALSYVNFRDFTARIAARDATTRQLVSASLQSRITKLQGISRMVAHTPSVVDALDARDQRVLADTVEPLFHHADVQVVEITDSSGVVLARGDAPATFGRTNDLSGWIVELATARQAALRANPTEPPREATTTRLIATPDRVLLVSATPIATVNQPLAGYAVAGQVVTPVTLAELHQGVGAGLSITDGTAERVTSGAAGLQLTRVAVPLPADLGEQPRLQLWVLQADEAERTRFWRTFWLAAAALLLVCGAIILRVARTVRDRVTEPLTAISGAMSALASGDRQVRIPLFRNQDEISQLAIAAQVFKQAMTDAAEREVDQERQRIARSAAEELARREARSREQLQSLIASAPAGLLVCRGAEHRVVLSNDAAGRFWGCSADALAGRTLDDLVGRAALADLEARLDAAGDAGVSGSDLSCRTIAGDAVRIGSFSFRRIGFDDGDALLAGLLDITERKQAEDSVRDALLRQRELNDMKTLFVSMTSHEFRTPLATILSSAELLQQFRDRLPAEEQTELLHGIELAVRRMTDMLDRILVIGRSDSGRLEFKAEPVGITGFFRQVAREAEDSVRRLRGATGAPWPEFRFVTKALGDGHDVALLDEKLLRHILGNLLSNAFKYSPAGGVVTLAIDAAGPELRFEVSDTGIGIPSEDLKGLFDTFHRGRNVGNISGTGLGMAIVGRSVELHGGTIGVESTEGRGTRFRVSLPLNWVSEGAPAKPDAT